VLYAEEVVVSIALGKGLGVGEGIEDAIQLAIALAGAEEARLLVPEVAVGAGALGSPAALYLAAAGVGCLGIVDDEALEMKDAQKFSALYRHTVNRHARPESAPLSRRRCMAPGLAGS